MKGKKNMRFSIIVPIYNVEKYISQCVESLVKQCCSDKFEILLINDGSTDNSKKYVISYLKNMIMYLYF